MCRMETDAILSPTQIRAFAAERDWRPARLAREAGLGVNTLRDLNSKDWSPQYSTLRRLTDFIAGYRDEAVT